MKALDVMAAGGRIRIEVRWTGRERVEYDGRVVSERRGSWKDTSEHAFEVDESGRRVRYEVVLRSRMVPSGFEWEIRRDGEVVDSGEREVRGGARSRVELGVYAVALALLVGWYVAHNRDWPHPTWMLLIPVALIVGYKVGSRVLRRRRARDLPEPADPERS